MPYIIQIKPSNYLLFVNENETVLDAALRQGFEIPYSCGSATCGTCMGQVISGTYSYGNIEPYALDAQARADNFALFCSVRPTSDMVIELNDVYGPEFVPPMKAEYEVSEHTVLAQDIYHVILEPSKKALKYHAGQHIQILCTDGAALPYSIANAPLGDGKIELYIKALPSNAYVSEVIQKITEKKTLQLRGPYGKMLWHKQPDLPILFIAGGTGVVPFKALIEQAIMDHDPRTLHLYWGATTADELYLHDYFQTLAHEHSQFTFTPVITQQSEYWQGETGLVQDVILDAHSDMTQYQVYASGPTEMVYLAFDIFTAKGLKPQLMYSDTFEYFPR